MEYDCVLWDWNGTIIDDCGIGLEAFNRVLEGRGRGRVSLDFYRSHVTTPIRDLYALFFDLDETPFAELDGEFNRHYAERAGDFALTKGILFVLRRFQDAGVRQAILTSSWAHVVERNARLLGVRSFFDAVLGGRSLSDGSKVERARIYIEENGIAPKRCLVIGDTAHDAEVALALGADCVLCGFGHQSRAVLERCGFPIANSPSQIEELAFGKT